MATDRAAASTAHQAETSRRASRYTGTAVSAKKSAFAALNQSYAASTLPARRRIAASTSARSGPKPYSSPRSAEALALDERGRRRSRRAPRPDGHAARRQPVASRV